MAYIELQDLLDELGEDILVQLTDNDGIGEVYEPRANKAIEFADGVFNSYARSRYSIPVLVTAMVKAVNLDLAIFHLYKSRTSIPEGVYKVRLDAFNSAIKWLKDLNSGNAGLDVPATQETIETPASSDKILTNAAKSKFSDNALKGY